MAGDNRDTLMTLERLLHSRNRFNFAINDQAPPQPVRTLNINDIYQHLEEFTAPVVPVVERPPQPMEIEVPAENKATSQIINVSENI